MPGPTIDQLIFKGTHNSYACDGKRAPWMNHPPETQIDGFGVWALELDYSLVWERGGPVPVVGHDRAGDRSCWGYTLADYLERILRARALAYRPVFLYLEAKTWKRRRLTPWRAAPDAHFPFEAKWEAALAALHATCGERFVLLDAWLREHEGSWPSPHDLAGKLVLYEPGLRDAAGRLVGLQSTHINRYVTSMEAEALIGPTRLAGEEGPGLEAGGRVLRLDQYQANWTFDYGVPPNPLIVDGRAGEATVVDDAVGRAWRLGEERSHGAVVHEHGTFRFPYRRVADAIERARGVTAATRGMPDARRAGYGWTLLLRGGADAGSLPEALGLRVEVE